MSRMVRPAQPPAWPAPKAGDRPLLYEFAVHAGVFAAALALVSIAWGPALDAWFVLDDYRWLLPSDRSHDVLRSFVGSWGHGWAYRPVMRLSFLADLQVFGWNARGWHLHNLVLHAANATLIFSLIRSATGIWAPPLTIAALFAVSPLGHENVAWISGRTYLLGGFFFLLSANLLLRSIQTGDGDWTAPGEPGTTSEPDATRAAWLFWSGAFAFAVAMATYEPTGVLPILAYLTVRCFPSLAAVRPGLVNRRLLQLFVVLLLFGLCRLVLLRGHVGDVGGASPLWFYAPLRYYVTTVVLAGQTLRIAVPIAIGAALVASAVWLRARPSIAPASARRLPAYLAIAGPVLFLPFSNIIGVADRFLYLAQLAGIASVTVLLWLIGRSSRAGATIAAATVVALAGAETVASRQAARDWVVAGLIVRAVAAGVVRLHPSWPSGVDAVFEGVPRMIGRAPVYVLYSREAVLHGYPDLRTLDARVYFADELAASPELRRQRGARPARYFHFDLEAMRLTEPAAADRETLPGK